MIEAPDHGKVKVDCYGATIKSFVRGKLCMTGSASADDSELIRLNLANQRICVERPTLSGARRTDDARITRGTTILQLSDPTRCTLSTRTSARPHAGAEVT